ncbi:hypothetical protein ACE38V_13555 [Cytobacillus sp. Hz8]
MVVLQGPHCYNSPSWYETMKEAICVYSFI